MNAHLPAFTSKKVFVRTDKIAASHAGRASFLSKGRKGGLSTPVAEFFRSYESPFAAREDSHHSTEHAFAPCESVFPQPEGSFGACEGLFHHSEGLFGTSEDAFGTPVEPRYFVSKRLS